jgi:hypothetical protein
MTSYQTSHDLIVLGMGEGGREQPDIIPTTKVIPVSEILNVPLNVSDY